MHRAYEATAFLAHSAEKYIAVVIHKRESRDDRGCQQLTHRRVHKGFQGIQPNFCPLVRLCRLAEVLLSWKACG